MSRARHSRSGHAKNERDGSTTLIKDSLLILALHFFRAPRPLFFSLFFSLRPKLAVLGQSRVDSVHDARGRTCCCPLDPKSNAGPIRSLDPRFLPKPCETPNFLPHRTHSPSALSTQSQYRTKVWRSILAVRSLPIHTHPPTHTHRGNT
jgi:hypothetical protein